MSWGAPDVDPMLSADVDGEDPSVLSAPSAPSVRPAVTIPSVLSPLDAALDVVSRAVVLASSDADPGRQAQAHKTVGTRMLRVMG